jgi:hypothetical protein
MLLCNQTSSFGSPFHPFIPLQYVENAPPSGFSSHVLTLVGSFLSVRPLNVAITIGTVRGAQCSSSGVLLLWRAPPLACSSLNITYAKLPVGNLRFASYRQLLFWNAQCNCSWSSCIQFRTTFLESGGYI